MEGVLQIYKKKWKKMKLQKWKEGVMVSEMTETLYQNKHPMDSNCKILPKCKKHTHTKDVIKLK